jgi:hypothetical protein
MRGDAARGGGALKSRNSEFFFIQSHFRHLLPSDREAVHPPTSGTQLSGTATVMALIEAQGVLRNGSLRYQTSQFANVKLLWSSHIGAGGVNSHTRSSAASTPQPPVATEMMSDARSSQSSRRRDNELMARSRSRAAGRTSGRPNYVSIGIASENVL